jgi:acetyltransferase-like isoleucine patch superfamily enzyme
MIRFKSLLNPFILYFYLKQFIFLYKYKGRLHSDGYRLSWEPLAQLSIDSNSNIHLGRQVHLRKNSDIEAKDGASVHIGSNFFMNKNSSIIARYGISIGDNCMIGENTSIIDHNHLFSDQNLSFKEQGYCGAPISIGSNVWIAGRVYIGPGVNIGDNVVIGANTIVTKSIPSNSVVYGKTELIIKPILECENNNE